MLGEDAVFTVLQELMPPDVHVATAIARAA
jgi:hypothetical protein